MNSENKNRITVDIYGTQYKLMSQSSGNYMRLVAAHVNEQMHQIAKGNPRLDMPRIAVLAAVNMADEYFKLANEWEKAQEELERKTASADLAKLQEENEKLMNQIKLHTKRLEDAKQNELSLMDYYRKLQAEHDEMFKQLAAAKEQAEQFEIRGRQYAEDYKKLQDEYAKLQSEYNEWIELVVHEQPDRKK